MSEKRFILNKTVSLWIYKRFYDTNFEMTPQVVTRVTPIRFAQGPASQRQQGAGFRKLIKFCATDCDCLPWALVLAAIRCAPEGNSPHQTGGHRGSEIKYLLGNRLCGVDCIGALCGQRPRYASHGGLLRNEWRNRRLTPSAPLVVRTPPFAGRQPLQVTRWTSSIWSSPIGDHALETTRVFLRPLFTMDVHCIQ